MAFLLHQLVAESAERNPTQIAVVDEDSALSYEQLERLSNQLARQLRDAGVRPHDRVGLLATKSVEVVAALLGIQKAGAAYVPVDPYAPPHRAAYILSNCTVRALVTTSDKVTRLPLDSLALAGLESVLLLDSGAELIHRPWPERLRLNSLGEVHASQPDGHFEVPITDSDLAYVLYTSGSTGEPKGVMISHRNSLTFVDWCYDTFRPKAEDHVSNHAPLHFDLSVFDLFCTLKVGATVYLVPRSVATFPAELARWIAENGISIWYSVPSALIQLVEHGRLEQCDYRRLRIVLFAGEVFPIKYLRQLVQALPHARYYNLYGPTETNVCTYYEVLPSDLDPARTEPVPIGKACANTEVFAVNDRDEVAGTGEEGELYVRSSTIMKGYWGRPNETAKVVLSNFLNPDYADLLYRTGDIVCLLPNGDYRYLGRRDKMIKARGYRIELGEIEATLYANRGVREAAVIAVPDERVGARIWAYVVSDDGLTVTDLEKFCSQRLPRYMVPERLKLLQKLPRTSTGKVDKTVLEKESTGE